MQGTGGFFNAARIRLLCRTALSLLQKDRANYWRETIANYNLQRSKRWFDRAPLSDHEAKDRIREERLIHPDNWRDEDEQRIQDLLTMAHDQELSTLIFVSLDDYTLIKPPPTLIKCMAARERLRLR